MSKSPGSDSSTGETISDIFQLEDINTERKTLSKKSFIFNGKSIK